MNFLSHPLHRDLSLTSVDHPHCLPWQRVLSRATDNPHLAGVSLEVGREARFRDAFAKISLHPDGGPEAGQGVIESPAAASEEPVGAGVVVSRLSFEAWMAGKSIRPPRDLGQPVR